MSLDALLPAPSEGGQLMIYQAGATIWSFRMVRREGARDVTRSIVHYSLEAILAVGYRVRSARGTAFRQWATARLGELLVKGFTLDDDRLKQGRTLGAAYFDELPFPPRSPSPILPPAPHKARATGAGRGFSQPGALRTSCCDPLEGQLKEIES